MGKMDKLMERFEPTLVKITNEPHMLAVRDALVTVVPFLVLGGFATFFSAILFADTSFLANYMDPDLMAKCATFFTRIGNGTMALLSIYLAMAIPYFYGSSKDFNNPFVLSMTSIAVFFAYCPLDGSNAYFGTTGVLLAILIGLGTADVFMKLSTNEKLKWNLGSNVPEVVGRSFSNLFVIVITVSAFALLAAIINVATGMETIEWIYSVLQQPLVSLGASIPGAIVYHLIGGFCFTMGIHPAGILAPLDAALMTAMGTDSIINYSFIYVYCMMGGCGCCMALTINLLLCHRKDLKGVGKMVFFPEVFNISEPVTFGLPIVFNFSLLIPMMFVPIVNTLIAYALTAAGIIPVLHNMIVWSMPVFVKGFVASGGNLMVTATEALLFVLDIFMWMPFVKMHEGSLNKQDAEAGITEESEVEAA